MRSSAIARSSPGLDDARAPRCRRRARPRRAPNVYHHRWIGEWAAAFPSARLHAPAGLAKKRRDLRIDRVIGAAPEPAFAGVIDELVVDGSRLEESVLVYAPART